MPYCCEDRSVKYPLKFMKARLQIFNLRARAWQARSNACGHVPLKWTIRGLPIGQPLPGMGKTIRDQLLRGFGSGDSGCTLVSAARAFRQAQATTEPPTTSPSNADVVIKVVETAAAINMPMHILLRL
jgi:hypothetical protein